MQAKLSNAKNSKIHPNVKREKYTSKVQKTKPIMETQMNDKSLDGRVLHHL
uniref:Uncharacterized protein n=1 Tax=Rhizophora mucronata TaxID=61149 RepID=A0A2P2NLY3_RHIMU